MTQNPRTILFRCELPDIVSGGIVLTDASRKVIGLSNVGFARGLAVKDVDVEHRFIPSKQINKATGNYSLPVTLKLPRLDSNQRQTD